MLSLSITITITIYYRYTSMILSMIDIHYHAGLAFAPLATGSPGGVRSGRRTAKTWRFEGKP